MYFLNYFGLVVKQIDELFNLIGIDHFTAPKVCFSNFEIVDLIWLSTEAEPSNFLSGLV